MKKLRLEAASTYGKPLPMPETHSTAHAVQIALADAAAKGAWRMYDGPRLALLRDVMGVFHARKHVRLCCSGTFGVELAVRSLQLPHDAEVLLAGYDFPGNLRAIQDAGAVARLADIAAGIWTPTPELLEQAIGQTTKAVVVSHLHGSLAPMAEICDWAKTRSLLVIEDACQAHGAIVDGRPAGSWGDVSVISFGGSKLIAAGRGGAVMTNDARLAQRMTIFCERGNDSFALSELQAAAILPQYEFLAQDHAIRAKGATLLAKHLARLNWIDFTPDRIHDANAYYKFGLLLNERLLASTRVQQVVKDMREVGVRSAMETAREWVLRRLADQGVEVGPGFRGFARRSTSRCKQMVPIPNSRRASEATMVLHHSHLLNPHTGETSIDRVVAAFESINQELGF